MGLFRTYQKQIPLKTLVSSGVFNVVELTGESSNFLEMDLEELLAF